MANLARLAAALLLGTFLYGWVAQSWFGVDVFKPTPASDQVSTGRCTLPHTKAHTTFFYTEDNVRFCAFEAIEGSFRKIHSPDADVCFVNGYNLKGRPIESGRYGPVCRVYLSETEWRSRHSRTSNKEPPNLQYLEKSSTVDLSTSDHLSYRILYSGPAGDESQLKSQLEDAYKEAQARAAFFMGPSDRHQVTIAIYQSDARIISDGVFPPVTGSFSDMNPNALCVQHYGSRTSSLDCPSERFAIWRSQLEPYANLSASRRRELFVEFAGLVVSYSDRSIWRSRRAVNHDTTLAARTIWLELLGNTHNVEPTEEAAFLKKHGLTKGQLDRVLLEGYVLGWAFPLIDDLELIHKIYKRSSQME